VKIRFANTAKISLHSAINFIHQDNPTAAANFLERVEKTLRRLEKYPESGRRIPEYPELPYRELLVLPYRFFYKIDGKTIFVVAVWHTAQIPIEPKKQKGV
jgi:toxin ParE1/3/4